MPLNIGSMVLFIILLVVLAFSVGLLLSVLIKYFFRADSQNIFVRVLHFLKAKSGYIASFGAGVFLAVTLIINTSPYKVASWVTAYDSATLGYFILIDKTAMQTGKIPKNAKDWYVKNYNPITGERL